MSEQKPLTPAERHKAFREKARALGRAQITAWLDPPIKEALLRLVRHRRQPAREVISDLIERADRIQQTRLHDAALQEYLRGGDADRQ